MAIYAVGSMYGSNNEKLPEFISRKQAFVGYSSNDAPGLHVLLNQISLGDIIFVKSFSPKAGLYIKAVGIVRKTGLFPCPEMGHGISVDWRWHTVGENTPVKMGKLDDRMDNMRGGTIYQEFNPTVAKEVISRLLGDIQ